jgi:hypothetical protein
MHTTVGPASVSSRKEALTEANVTHILNATDTEPCHFPETFTYHRVAVQDTVGLHTCYVVMAPSRFEYIMHVCVYIYMCVCMYVYVHVYIDMFVWVGGVYVCIRCIYIYIYT